MLATGFPTDFYSNDDEDESNSGKSLKRSAAAATLTAFEPSTYSATSPFDNDSKDSSNLKTQEPAITKKNSLRKRISGFIKRIFE